MEKRVKKQNHREQIGTEGENVNYISGSFSKERPINHNVI